MCEVCGYSFFKVIINLKVAGKKFNAFEKSASDLFITHYCLNVWWKEIEYFLVRIFKKKKQVKVSNNKYI